jgi:hypothetical protein
MFTAIRGIADGEEHTGNEPLRDAVPLRPPRRRTQRRRYGTRQGNGCHGDPFLPPLHLTMRTKGFSEQRRRSFSARISTLTAAAHRRSIVADSARDPSRPSPTVCRSECTSSPANLRSEWSCGQVRGRPHRERCRTVMVSLPPCGAGAVGASSTVRARPPIPGLVRPAERSGSGKSPPLLRSTTSRRTTAMTETTRPTPLRVMADHTPASYRPKSDDLWASLRLRGAQCQRGEGDRLVPSWPGRHRTAAEAAAGSALPLLTILAFYPRNRRSGLQRF